MLTTPGHVGSGSSSPVERLRASESLLLDFIRVSAAIMVAGGHLTGHLLSTGWTDYTILARAAVGVFFVLSGFVIRYVTCLRPGTFDGYAKDRASRIYSVVIPALVLTVLFNSIALNANPGFMAIWAKFQDHPFQRILENLIFTAQIWTRDVSPLTNGPFWSLNYEVAYYALYGCAFYLTGGKRWFWIVAIALFVGPKTLLLFPVWLIGCLGHDLYQRWNAEGNAARYLNRAIAGMVVMAVVALAAIRLDHGLLSSAIRMDTLLKAESEHLKLGSDGGALGFYAVAIFGGILFLRVLLSVRTLKIQESARPVRLLKFIAEGTFPIYLFHLPMYIMIAACLRYDHGSSIQKISIFFVVVTLCVLAGAPCNYIKRKLRKLTLRKRVTPELSPLVSVVG